MNQWSRNRKRLILAIVVFTIVILIGVPGYLLFYRAPTCFDGAMNADESGVDCGGSCQLLCKAESLPLILKGDPRVLTVASSTFEVVALVENPNNSAEILHAGYIIKLYDAESIIPIKEIEGDTYAPKSVTFAIFVEPFTLEAGVVPKRATLEWKKETMVWEKNMISYPQLRIKEAALLNASTSPRLEAELENLSLDSASFIELVALLSDAEGNIFAASKTFADKLVPGEALPLVFTWPRPFKAEAAGINIIIRVFPDRSFIR